MFCKHVVFCTRFHNFRKTNLADEARQSQMHIVHKVSDHDNCNNCQMHRNDIDCHRGLPWHLLLEFLNVEQSGRRHRETTKPQKGSEPAQPPSRTLAERGLAWLPHFLGQQIIRFRPEPTIPGASIQAIRSGAPGGSNWPPAINFVIWCRRNRTFQVCGSEIRLGAIEEFPICAVGVATWATSVVEGAPHV